jgi:hypothetical protein
MKVQFKVSGEIFRDLFVNNQTDLLTNMKSKLLKFSRNS